MPNRLVDTSAILGLSPANPAPVADRRSNEGDTPHWRSNRALGRAAAIIGTVALLAVAFGRPDFIVMAAPLVLGTVMSLISRPRVSPTATMSLDINRVAEGDEVTARLNITNPDPVGIVTVVNANSGAMLRLQHGTGYYVDALPGNGSAEIILSGTTLRWGNQSIGPAWIQGIACDGLLLSQRKQLKELPVRVYPNSGAFDSSQDLPKAAGMAGIHRSRRPGDGGELAEVRKYQPGDRLRRIDWRTSSRQRDLYVNSTLSERDADIILVMDVLHDAVGNAAGGTSILDVTVRATASIAEHYVHQGDRVSIVEFGSQYRRLRPGTGRRHYMRALEWLVDTRVAPGGPTTMSRLVSSGGIPHGSVVVVLTPLIDERTTEGLAWLAQSGHPMITVDTLPPGLVPPYRSEWTDVASRLWRIQRDNTVRRLQQLGVPVEEWRGSGTLDSMLIHLAKIERAPKARRR